MYVAVDNDATKPWVLSQNWFQSEALNVEANRNRKKPTPSCLWIQDKRVKAAFFVLCYVCPFVDVRMVLSLSASLEESSWEVGAQTGLLWPCFYHGWIGKHTCVSGSLSPPSNSSRLPMDNWSLGMKLCNYLYQFKAALFHLFKHATLYLFQPSASSKFLFQHVPAAVKLFRFALGVFSLLASEHSTVKCVLRVVHA